MSLYSPHGDMWGGPLPRMVLELAGLLHSFPSVTPDCQAGTPDGCSGAKLLYIELKCEIKRATLN